MVLTVFDTSALAKRYLVSEPGHERVRAICADPARKIAVSRLLQTEFASTVGRLARTSQLSGDEADVAWRTFLRDAYVEYLIVPLASRIHVRAENLLRAHPIRSLDAIHIATALEAEEFTGDESLEFCTADARQLDAAAAEGLPLVYISG